MDTLWSNLVKGLQEGAVVAADKAGDLTRIARARLNIAATKNQIQRTQTDLGARVHELLTAGSDLAADTQVQALCNQLTAQGDELLAAETAYADLQSELQSRDDADTTDAELEGI